MPRWNEHGERMKSTVFECAAYQYNIRATCRCGHSSVFHPHALWWLFYRKGWDDNLRRAGGRFRCLRCGKGPVVLETTSAEPTITRLPLPSDRDWKKAVNRFRS